MKTLLVVIAAQMFVAALIFLVFIKEPEFENKLVEHKIPCEYLESRYEIMLDSVADLEEKAEILNRYLNMKHIEYIEVCNLVHRKKK